MAGGSLPRIYGTYAAPIECLLKRWHEVVAEAAERMRPYLDLPYWYNEKANVGYVAQAAWQCGFAFVEENTVDRDRGGGVYLGRADLWIGDPLGHEHEFEFKLYWPSVKSTKKTLAENIKWYLGKAQEQLDDIADKGGRQPGRVAMVFVCPSVAESDRDRWKQLLDRFVKKRVTRPDVYGSEFSTVFVPGDDLQGQNRVAADGYLYPAIAVFGKTVR